MIKKILLSILSFLFLVIPSFIDASYHLKNASGKVLNTNEYLSNFVISFENNANILKEVKVSKNGFSSSRSFVVGKLLNDDNEQIFEIRFQNQDGGDLKSTLQKFYLKKRKKDSKICSVALFGKNNFYLLNYNSQKSITTGYNYDYIISGSFNKIAFDGSLIDFFGKNTIQIKENFSDFVKKNSSNAVKKEATHRFIYLYLYLVFWLGIIYLTSIYALQNAPNYLVSIILEIVSLIISFCIYKFLNVQFLIFLFIFIFILLECCFYLIKLGNKKRVLYEN